MTTMSMLKAPHGSGDLVTENKSIKSKRVYVNSRELSEIISLPVTAIQRLVREKAIPAYQLDRKQYMFKLDEVISAIESRRVK